MAGALAPRRRAQEVAVPPTIFASHERAEARQLAEPQAFLATRATQVKIALAGSAATAPRSAAGAARARPATASALPRAGKMALLAWRAIRSRRTVATPPASALAARVHPAVKDSIVSEACAGATPFPAPTAAATRTASASFSSQVPTGEGPSASAERGEGPASRAILPAPTPARTAAFAHAVPIPSAARDKSA